MSDNPTISRRQLIASSLLGLVACQAHAQGDLDPSKPRATALGYRRDHRKVDLKRWPKKASEDPAQPQRCASCAQRAADGGCGLFNGQRVAENGWCNAWTRR